MKKESFFLSAHVIERTYNMLLSDLLSKIEYTSCKGAKDVEITSICRDSRQATDGSLFVCIRGTAVDGHDFARSAYIKGARVFLAEEKLDLPCDATVVIVPDTRVGLAEASAEFYSHPEKELKIVGITGTKGKTTTALTAYGVLNAAGISTGYIGSNGVRFASYRYTTANTTPESCELYKYMRLMVSAGVKCLVMEVSSQAIYMGRIRGIGFDVAVFTNLYLDHVGGVEHPTFEHYRDSKRRLFTEYGAKTIVYNADDAHAEYMIADTDAELIACSCEDKHADMKAKSIKVPGADSRLCVSFDIEFDNDRAHTSVAMPGRFSVYNALLTAAICKSVGLSVFRTAKLLPTVSIDGRFEVVEALPDATFVIDYAHNGASLSAALTALREYKPKRLVCLFGSVGGRTFGRRHELGKVAAAMADLCIITSDNPDGEAPEKIINEIAECFVTEGGCPHVKITDRRDAIRYAVKNARSGDIILLAGKGHEDYQLVNGKKLPFSERAIILEAAEELLEV